jgi:hypothetical protein
MAAGCDGSAVKKSYYLRAHRLGLRALVRGIPGEGGERRRRMLLCARGVRGRECDGDRENPGATKATGHVSSPSMHRLIAAICISY